MKSTVAAVEEPGSLPVMRRSRSFREQFHEPKARAPEAATPVETCKEEDLPPSPTGHKEDAAAGESQWRTVSTPLERATPLAIKQELERMMRDESMVATANRRAKEHEKEWLRKEGAV